MTSVRRVLLETLAPAGGGKAHDRAAANPDGTLTVTPDAPDWGSPIDQLSAADSPTGFLEEEHGSHPGQLFGKFTWRIDNFAEISKRELRSHQFEVGDYKWYILVYPQGCDVCNHLSLFLCVADYDKLLPGWSHFAQFTIAVVNKDPKKSKYSDTLHRFCKKEHDWGWKKFMERGKVLGGFSVGGSLLIKAQVQVILDRPCRPFRCLDAQYRRELVRVYLTNVEALCRRFCEERRQRLAWLRAEAAGFAAWWRSLSSEAQQQLTQRVPGGPILKGLARQFFNEKEVTSSLVMDALFCGCKQLERLGRGQGGLPEGSVPPCVVIDGASASFSFALDALAVVGQLAAEEWLPSSRDAKPLPLGAEGLSLRSGGCDELSEARRDALQRDEARLAQLGRRSVEMFALAHIFTEQLERAYRHHQAEVRMADLIAEEEAAGRLQDARAAARAAADREKRAKKKERQKAKKEAERSKRDAEAAENSKQQHERHGEQQQPQEQATARLQQQEQQQTKKAAAAGAAVARSSRAVALSGEHRLSDDRLAAGLRADHQQQQQQQPSSQQSGAAAPWAQHMSSSSPGPASAADSDSGSDDGSDSGSVGSSSKGFVPVLRQQQQRQRETAAVSQHGAGGWGATHNVHNQPPRQQQQQQQQQQPNSSGCNGQANAGSGCSSGTSTPIGYAAAVAGMRPPPPAEVTAAAIAMAEQQRQLRELQEQAAALKQQVSVLEAAVRHRDALLAQRDQEAAELKQQLAQQGQQVQDLRKQAADWRAAAAAAAGSSNSSGSHSGGSADTKSFAAVAAAGAADGGGLSNRGGRGSSRSRGASVDLSDAGAPASWSAIAAGTAAAGRAAAAASGNSTAGGGGGAAAAGTAAEHAVLQPAEPAGPEQRPGASCHSAGGGSIVAAADPATPVAAAQHKLAQLRPSSSGGSHSIEPDSISTAAVAAEGTPSSSHSRSRQQREQPAAGSSELGHTCGLPLAFSSSSSSDGGALPAMQLAEAAGPGSMSSMDAPVSPRDLPPSIAASAPGPVGSTSSIDTSTAPGSSSNDNSSSSSSVAADKQHRRSNTSSSGGSLPSATVRLAGSGSSSSAAELSSRAAHLSSSSCEVLSSSLPEALPGLAALRVSPAATRHGSFLGNGIAGAVALQCGSPLCGDGSPAQLTPSYSTAAGGSIDMAAAGAAAAVGLRSSSKSKLGPAEQQQHSFAGFGSQMAADTQPMFGGLPAPSKAGGAAAAASGQLEDLAGFVHMNMIDDLLSGSE